MDDVYSTIHKPIITILAVYNNNHWYENTLDFRVLIKKKIRHNEISIRVIVNLLVRMKDEELNYQI